MNIVGFDTVCYHIRLKSLNCYAIAEAEKAQHDLFWVNKEEVKNLLSWPTHQYQWSQFIDNRAYTNDGLLVNS